MAEAETRKIEWPDDGVSRIPYQIYTDPDNILRIFYLINHTLQNLCHLHNHL